MRPSCGTRCPKDCPQRKVGCHNEETCECWRKQKEEDRERLAKEQERFETKRRTWEQRGMHVRLKKMK